jgi:hypothetical protein
MVGRAGFEPATNRLNQRKEGWPGVLSPNAIATAKAKTTGDRERECAEAEAQRVYNLRALTAEYVATL